MSWGGFMNEPDDLPTPKPKPRPTIDQETTTND